MSDPFEVLRSELVQAAGRVEPAPPTVRWRLPRRRPRPLAVVLAALVICGSATAAVLSLTASPSQPLSGRVPGSVASPRPGLPLSVAGYLYRIVITPSLAAGQPGWITGIGYARSTSGLAGGGESAGGVYPTATNPVFGGVGDGFVWSGGQHGDTVAIVLVGPQVAAIRFGERTIRTFASPQLPLGDRAAVFFVWSGSPSSAHVLPLDSAGRILPTTFSYPDTPFESFWQAPAALTPNIHEPPYHGPTRPSPSGICQLTSGGLPGLIPAWGHTIARFGPATASLGELFESCVDTEYYLHGWPLAVGVLLDARRPGQVLGPLPGATAVPGRSDEVDFGAANLSARRIGHAWLVVRGGAGRAQRLQVLDALRISKLDLRR